MVKLPSSEDLWKRHERYILNIFLLALVRLRDEDSLPEDEPTLNERLYVHARYVYCSLPCEQKPMSFVNRNSEIPPRRMEEVGERWTKKKPDFQWELTNTQEANPEKAIKEYTIECKRLAEKTSAGRSFINEYVVNGIIRFISKEHRYGIGTISGVMIGYVQNLVHAEVLKQINLTVQKSQEYKIPEIMFYHLEDLSGIIKGNHTLIRKEVSPSNFDLRHIWVELMN